MAWRGGAGEVVDFVDFQKQRLDDVVPQELEIRTFQQMGDVGFLAGEKVIGADDIVALIDQALAQMRTQKARAPVTKIRLIPDTRIMLRK